VYQCEIWWGNGEKATYCLNVQNFGININPQRKKPEQCINVPWKHGYNGVMEAEEVEIRRKENLQHKKR
jgi:hypothetical protein